MQQLKSSKLYTSLCHSTSGIRLLWKHEKSIVLELTVLPVISILIPFFCGNFKGFLLLICINLLVLAIEALNSATEKVCDLITLEYRDKIKYAKDAGSFAVLSGLVIYFIAVFYIMFS